MVNAVEGSGYSVSISSEVQTYVATSYDTVSSIADQFGVTPEALVDANPDIFVVDSYSGRPEGGMRTSSVVDLTGRTLTIPAAVQSVTDGVPAYGHSPVFQSTTTEYSLTKPKSGRSATKKISWNPEAGSVKSSWVHKEGFGIKQSQYKVSTEVSVGTGVRNVDGMTEVSVSSTVKSVADISLNTKKGAVFSAAEGAGERVRFKVLLPGENQSPELAVKVDPFNPDTIPVGATVILDQQGFTDTKLEASFRNIRVGSESISANGTSYAVTRIDEASIRVTMGPVESVEKFRGVGFSSSIASAMLGGQSNRGESNLRTASFDLTSPDGQLAYLMFNATGKVADQAPGVSDVATIERIDEQSYSRVKAELGPIGIDLKGDPDEVSIVKASYPDGSYSYTVDMEYGSNVPLRVVEKFDADGNEILSERTYSFLVDVNKGNVDYLNQALFGDADDLMMVGEGKTELRFTDEQMYMLMEQTNDAILSKGGPINSGLNSLFNSGDNSGVVYDESNFLNTSTYDFAHALARNLNGDDFGFVMKLFDIADGSGESGGVSDFESINATAIPLEE